MVDYDFNEPLVRKMVETNHRPIEWRERLLDRPTEVRCSICDVHWPCPTLRELREWEGEALKKEWMRLPKDTRVIEPECCCPGSCWKHPRPPRPPWDPGWWRVTWDHGSFPTYTSTWTWRYR